jgi:hypothetical protein
VTAGPLLGTSSCTGKAHQFSGTGRSRPARRGVTAMDRTRAGFTSATQASSSSGQIADQFTAVSAAATTRSSHWRASPDPYQLSRVPPVMGETMVNRRCLAGTR